MFHVKQAVSPLTAGDGRALFVEDLVEGAVGLDRHSSNYSGDGKRRMPNLGERTTSDLSGRHLNPRANARLGYGAWLTQDGLASMARGGRATWAAGGLPALLSGSTAWPYCVPTRGSGV